MKHQEIYDKHADRKSGKKKLREQRSEERQRRVSFKNYVRELEEQLLDDGDISEDVAETDR